MRRSHLATCIFLFAACVGAVWWGSRALRPSAPGTAADPLLAAQSAFGAMALASTAQLSDVKAAGEALAGLSQAVRLDPTLKSLENVEVKQLLDEIVRFVSIRFGSHDAASYLAWRQAQGLNFRKFEMLDDWHKIGAWYLGESGMTASQENLEQVFKDMWQTESVGRGARESVGGVVTDADGMAVVIGRISPARPSAPHVANRFDMTVWHGAIGNGSVRWFDSSERLAALLDRDRSVYCASVGLVVRTSNGVRLPMLTKWFWDRDRARWTLDTLSFNNYDRAKFSAKTPYCSGY